MSDLPTALSTQAAHCVYGAFLELNLFSKSTVQVAQNVQRFFHVGKYEQHSNVKPGARSPSGNKYKVRTRDTSTVFIIAKPPKPAPPSSASANLLKCPNPLQPQGLRLLKSLFKVSHSLAPSAPGPSSAQTSVGWYFAWWIRPWNCQAKPPPLGRRPQDGDRRLPFPFLQC